MYNLKSELISELDCDKILMVAYLPKVVPVVNLYHTVSLPLFGLFTSPAPVLFVAQRLVCTLSPDGFKVTFLERQIDYFQRKLPELTNFILPGGTTAAANLHLARAVCRRVERSFVLLLNNSDFANLKIVYPYLNRLSDLLFVLARFSNYTVGVKDQIWKGANV